MNQTISIRISGIQREISDEPTVVECTGTLHSDSGQHYLRYTDPDGIKTMIKIRQGHAIVTRSGALSSVMDFNESERTACVYPTPYGLFDTVIETGSVRLFDEDISGETAASGQETGRDPFPHFARIEYDLTMNGQKISGCELNIYISRN